MRSDVKPADPAAVVYERHCDLVIARSPGTPGARGQGRTKEEARASLESAIRVLNPAKDQQF